MPTKPDPVNDLPPLWGGAGNYLAGVYPPTLPWGAAHPLAGQPLPWGGQPRLNSTDLANFADTGLTPQVPNDASKFNEWLRRVAIWQTNWVALGTNAPDADAHIMETTAAGLSRAVAYEATTGYQNSGPAAAVLLMGFSVPAGETSSFGDNTTVTLGANALIDAPTTSNVRFGTLRLKVGAPAPTVDGEIAASTGGTPIFRASGLGRYMFGGINGPWLGIDADQVPETALAATTLLTTSSKTDVNGLVRVRVSGEMQRSAAGSCILSLQEDQGTATWTDIDNGGVTTKTITTVGTVDPNAWTGFHMERTFGAGATDRFFRMRITAGASTAKIRDTHLTVRRLGA